MFATFSNHIVTITERIFALTVFSSLQSIPRKTVEQRCSKQTI